jgi:hypothetical protein
MASGINEKVSRFIRRLADRPVQRRIVDYVINEVHTGRGLMEVIDDPYVRNNLNNERVVTVLLENPKVLDALEQEIRAPLDMPDSGDARP